MERRELPPNGGSVLIGRRATAFVCLTDPTVSRAHAELTRVDDIWVLEDIGSTAGTLLIRAGVARRVTARIALRHDDRIKAGSVALRFEQPTADVDEGETVRVGLTGEMRLTDRERDVLLALATPQLHGLSGAPSDAELAAELVVSPETIKTYLGQLYAKFRLRELPNHRKRPELVRRAIDEGWVARPAGG